MFTGLRLAILSACLIWSAFDLLTGRPTWFLPLLGAAFLAVGHFRSVTVPLAFRAARKGDLQKAQHLLSKTKRPDQLSGQSRAYLEWTRGMIAVGGGDFTLARQALDRAIDGKLRTSNDRCLVLASLAGVCSELGEHRDARAHMAAARSLPRKPEAEAFLEEVLASMDI